VGRRSVFGLIDTIRRGPKSGETRVDVAGKSTAFATGSAGGARSLSVHFSCFQLLQSPELAEQRRKGKRERGRLG